MTEKQETSGVAGTVVLCLFAALLVGAGGGALYYYAPGWLSWEDQQRDARRLSEADALPELQEAIRRKTSGIDGNAPPVSVATEGNIPLPDGREIQESFRKMREADAQAQRNVRDLQKKMGIKSPSSR